MERAQQKQLVEALIVAGGEPVSAARLAEIVPGLEASEVAGIVAELTREYEEQGRALEIWQVAGGYQLRTSPGVAPYLRALHRERALRLTRAALETLAVIAYRQPVTRAEVEHVRGVDAGPVLKSLVDRKLVRIAGHREVPGRPLVYATTKRFLEVFGLQKLDDLPTLREVEELLPPPDAAADVTPLDAEAAEAIVSAPPAGELH
jgi:segregation and condensation protein B